MAEPPDFDQIAREIAEVGYAEFDNWGAPPDLSAIVAKLCQVWNARGAADIEAKHAAFRVDVGLGGALVDLEDEAIRNLDR